MEFSSANDISRRLVEALAADAVAGVDAAVATLSPAEAARRLGVTRSRIYALVRQGELDDIGAETLRVTLDSVQRRLAANAPVGEPIKPLDAWAILALASSDAAFRAHVAASRSSQEPGSGSRTGACSTWRGGCASAASPADTRPVPSRCSASRGCPWRPGGRERRAAARLTVARW